MPKVPFFLFDIQKATDLEGENAARDFLTETFFTSFDQQRKEQANAFKSGAQALAKHDVEAQLKSFLKKESTDEKDAWWR